MDEDRFYQDLGEMIKHHRKARGLTQEDLGTQIGLTRTSVINIEQGRQRVLTHTVFEIAAALEINAAADLLRKAGNHKTRPTKIPSSFDPEKSRLETENKRLRNRLTKIHHFSNLD